MHITTIGLDLAKHWFQVHGVDAAGKVVVKTKVAPRGGRRVFSRLEPCLVGMEACATAHHWARELIALGHEVKLMPPAYVKAYVKRNKNDAADAEAICEAVTRPSMRFVPVKDVDQQAVLMMHRARKLLVRQRTMLVNALRAHLAEFGIIAPQGLRHVEQLVEAIEDDRLAHAGTRAVDSAAHRGAVERHAGQSPADRGEAGQMASRATGSANCWRRFPASASWGRAPSPRRSAIPNMFRSGREFAAWLGMTPRQNSSGGKERLGGTSKRGDKYIRCLLVGGGRRRICGMRATGDEGRPNGCARMLARKPAKVVALALANKTARIVWAVMERGEAYQPKGDRRASGLKRPPSRNIARVKRK